MRCNQCDSCYINGLFCHETGCPNWNKTYDNITGQWYTPEPEPEDEDEDAETWGMVEYEDAVTTELAAMLDLSRSDAQGIIEAHEWWLHECFADRKTVEEAAEIIHNVSLCE